MGVSENEIGLREARTQLGDIANRAHLVGEITYLMRNGRRIAAIVPTSLVPQEHAMPTFQILASDGSEEPSAGPAWLIVDTSDSVVEAVPFRDGDTIENAVTRFVDAGHLPVGTQLERQDRMHDPYPWQPSGYWFRYHVAKPVRDFTLSLIEGDAGLDANGHDLADASISYGDLDDDTTAWLKGNGFDTESPARWVLVTSAGEDPSAANVITSRDITI